jgi:hypothetical protein
MKYFETFFAEHMVLPGALTFESLRSAWEIVDTVFGTLETKDFARITRENETFLFLPTDAQLLCIELESIEQVGQILIVRCQAFHANPKITITDSFIKYEDNVITPTNPGYEEGQSINLTMSSGAYFLGELAWTKYKSRIENVQLLAKKVLSINNQLKTFLKYESPKVLLEGRIKRLNSTLHELKETIGPTQQLSIPNKIVEPLDKKVLRSIKGLVSPSPFIKRTALDKICLFSEKGTAKTKEGVARTCSAFSTELPEPIQKKLLGLWGEVPPEISNPQEGTKKVYWEDEYSLHDFLFASAWELLERYQALVLQFSETFNQLSKMVEEGEEKFLVLK